jgi:hypothetical protein
MHKQVTTLCPCQGFVCTWSEEERPADLHMAQASDYFVRAYMGMSGFFKNKQTNI